MKGLGLRVPSSEDTKQLAPSPLFVEPGVACASGWGSPQPLIRLILYIIYYVLYIIYTICHIFYILLCIIYYVLILSFASEFGVRALGFWLWG